MRKSDFLLGFLQTSFSPFAIFAWKTNNWNLDKIGLALIHLFVSGVQGIRIQIEGKRLAEIASFSGIHFVLEFLLIIAFAITFDFLVLKTKVIANAIIKRNSK